LEKRESPSHTGFRIQKHPAIFLIISPNVISILLGWDGLGLVSYLLVSYYQNGKSYGAGMLTVLSNRIGDVALLIVIA
jgi:NADH-ubiquinone oxidoreductase chain 5